jgi:uncharacterized phiE125 gp8 family phage protein
VDLQSYLPTSKPIRTVAPTFAPVTLEEARAAVSLPSTLNDYDVLLERLIGEATDAVEHDTGLVLCTSTWAWKLDQWSCDYIVCPVRPVASISSIVYVDSAGTSTTWSASNYTLDTYRVQPIILRAFVAGVQSTFPTLRTQENAVTVTVMAGAAQADVSRLAKSAVLTHVARAWHENDKAYDTSYDSAVNRLMRSSYP